MSESYLTGNMFHGTTPVSARKISGLRVNRPNEEPEIRTAFIPNEDNVRRKTNYSRRFGPGLYLTDNFSEAHKFARDQEEYDMGNMGAIVEGKVTSKNPIHITEDEFNKVGLLKSTQEISKKISKMYPHYMRPIPHFEAEPSEAGYARKKIIESKNFSELEPELQNYFTNYDENKGKSLRVPWIENDRIVTGADRAAANLLFRQKKYDYVHIDGSKNKQWGVVLRPSSRGLDATFKARKVHFLDGMQSGRVEEV